MNDKQVLGSIVAAVLAVWALYAFTHFALPEEWWMQWYFVPMVLTGFLLMVAATIVPIWYFDER